MAGVSLGQQTLTTLTLKQLLSTVHYQDGFLFILKVDDCTNLNATNLSGTCLLYFNCTDPLLSQNVTVICSLHSVFITNKILEEKYIQSLDYASLYCSITY